MGHKVALGFPCGGSVTVPFHGSLQRLLAYEIQKPDRERLLAKEMHAQGLYVGGNRQVLVEQFMKGSADWLLQIDTDIEFPKTILETLLLLTEGERLIIAANVPLGDPRLGAHATVAYRATETPGLFDNFARMPADLFKCDAVATAVVLVHRSVFEKMTETEGEAWFLTKRYPASPAGTPIRAMKWRELGEDLSFCIRARDHGFDVWCAHVRGLKHYKTCALSEDQERDQRLAFGPGPAPDLGEMGEIVSDETPEEQPLFGVIGG